MKYVSFGVCIALLLVSLLLVWNGNAASDVQAGPGDGVNEQIDTPEAFMDFLKSFDEDSMVSAHIPEQGVSVLSADKDMIGLSGSEDDESESDADDNDASPSVKYDSVTIHEDVYMSTYAYYHYRDNSESRSATANVKLNRSLTMYMTEDVSYYHSVGSLFMNSDSVTGKPTSTTTTSHSYVDFDMEVYLNLYRDECLVKFNNWAMVGNDVITISDEIIGKWVTFPDSVSDDIYGVDGLNKEAFTVLQSIVETALSNNEFRRSDNTYKLGKTNVYLPVIGAKQASVDFMLDMADAERPMVRMNVTDKDHAADNGSVGTDFYETESKVYMDALYTFENINNTVIEMADDVDVIRLTDDNVDQYIYMAD